MVVSKYRTHKLCTVCGSMFACNNNCMRFCPDCDIGKNERRLKTSKTSTFSDR